MAEIEEKIADEEYDKIIIARDFNCYPNKGMFLKELKYR